jgi:hypothetical protein
MMLLLLLLSYNGASFLRRFGRAEPVKARTCGVGLCSISAKGLNGTARRKGSHASHPNTRQNHEIRDNAFLLTLAACAVRRIKTPYICKRLPI